jgi:hypothetical protein
MSKTAFLLILITLSLGLAGLTGCTGTTGQGNSAIAVNGANSDPNLGRVPHSGGECAEGGGEPATAIGSPVEAYTFLFDAVKKGDTDAVKQISSKATRELAQFTAGSYKKSCAEAYKNGFTETAMQEKMPETRDLRTSDDGNVASMEVKTAKGTWEDVPFVKEGNGWKLAIGDLFFGKIKRVGTPQSFREQENANARGLGNLPINPMANKNGANGNTFKPVPVPNEPINKPLRRPGQPLANQPKP